MKLSLLSPGTKFILPIETVDPPKSIRGEVLSVNSANVEVDVEHYVYVDGDVWKRDGRKVVNWCSDTEVEIDDEVLEGL